MRVPTPLASTVLALLLAGRAAADDFYLDRLQEGRDALRAGNLMESVELLQVACFGLLNRPPLYAEGLAWLAVAQGKAERDADLGLTLRRFLELESRFPSYAKADLPPAVRSEFDRLLVKRIPAERLAAIPSLSALIETEEQKLEKMAPLARAKALEAKAKAAPKDPAWPLLLAQTFDELSDPKKAELWAGRALEIDATNASARAIRARARVARREFAEALADLDLLPGDSVRRTPALMGDRFLCLVATKQWKPAREAIAALPEAQQRRPEVAAARKRIPAETPETVETAAGTASAPTGERSPGASRDETIAAAGKLISEGRPAEAKNLLLAASRAGDSSRETRSRLLEAACLSKDWKTAKEQVGQLQPFGNGEERYAFYSAVVLFESGSLQEAQALMKQAQGKLARSPYVDYYMNRILGPR